ncbi:MAG: DUF1634 domain-containing protein [Nitrososphaerota archaeon]|jgi:uncharacterized membrane protein|nr:DUF1634 domain-containing protein [Nitrososphaerota archaeon]
MNLERVIALTLRIGVVLSASLVAGGLVLFYAEGLANPPASSSFTLPAVIAGVAGGNPVSLMLLGIVVLVITPVLRVSELALNYLWQRDRLYAVISLLVLLLMMVGIVLLPVFYHG